MITVGALVEVVVKSALIVVFFSLPSPIIAFAGFRHWSRKVICNKIDLVNKACYNQILPGLYLSNARAATDRDILKRLKITHVLTVQAHSLPKSVFENTNITTLHIKAYDNSQINLLRYFPMANAFIEEGIRTGNVLVHCRVGVSRSPTLVIAYIMEKYKMNFEEAFHYVKQRRKFINPNPGFVNQLKEYQRINYDVKRFNRFEAYLRVNVRKHKYKLVSLAAIAVGVLVSIAVFIA